MESDLLLEPLRRAGFISDWSDDEHFPGDHLSPDQITSGQGNNIFHVAAKYHESCAEKLDPFLPRHPLLAFDTNAKGDTPLHIAARLGKFDFASSLVGHARDLLEVKGNYKNLLRKVNKKKNTALHEAVQNGHCDVANLLIEEDSTLACFENEAGDSPLFLAVDGEYYEIAQTILETSLLNCSFSGRNGMTVLHAAVIRAPDQLVDEDETSSIFIDGIMRSNQNFVENTLRKWGPDILHIPDRIGWMPHHYAANMGKSRLVRRFLEAESSLAYIKDEEGMSALHISARNGHTNVIKLLIQKSPDVCELLDKKDRTALHVAVEHNQVAVVRILMSTKAFTDLVNEQDADGNTALHLACIHGHYRIIRLLINTRTNKRAINKLGMTAFDIINRSSIVGLFQKCMIRSKCKGEHHPWTSLEGAAAAWNRRKENHEITPLDDTQVSQPNDQAPVKNASKDSRDKIAMKTAADINLVVSTIIASISYTAAMAVPGGYDSSNGLAILRNQEHFRDFLIFDSYAFGYSVASMIIYFLTEVTSNFTGKSCRHPFLVTYVLICLSICSSVWAFDSGTKAVLYETKSAPAYVLPWYCAFDAFFTTLIAGLLFLPALAKLNDQVNLATDGIKSVMLLRFRYGLLKIKRMFFT